MRKLIALFLVVIMVLSIVSCAKIKNDIDTDNDEKESVTETEKETETEEPNSLAKVVSISLERYSGKGKCSIYWGDPHGKQIGKSLMGVTRVLYRTQKSKVYNEISLSKIGSADGTGISIEEDNELMHLIVVFKKDYKLTDNNKNFIKELGLDYMFER